MCGTGFRSRLSNDTLSNITNRKIISCMQYLNANMRVETNIDNQFRVINWIKKNTLYDIGFRISREKDSIEHQFTLSINIHNHFSENKDQRGSYQCTVLLGINIFNYSNYIVNGDVEIGNKIRDCLISHLINYEKQSGSLYIQDIVNTINDSSDIVNILSALDQLTIEEMPIIDSGLDTILSDLSLFKR